MGRAMGRVITRSKRKGLWDVSAPPSAYTTLVKPHLHNVSWWGRCKVICFSLCEQHWVECNFWVCWLESGVQCFGVNSQDGVALVQIQRKIKKWSTTLWVHEASCQFWAFAMGFSCHFSSHGYFILCQLQGHFGLGGRPRESTFVLFSPGDSAVWAVNYTYCGDLNSLQVTKLLCQKTLACKLYAHAQGTEFALG